MKKLVVSLIFMAAFPIAFMAGCSSQVPTSSNSATSIPTSTPAAYSTPQSTNPAMVNLGSAVTYGILASTQITNSGASTVCGNIGLDSGTLINGGINLTCGGVSQVNNSTVLAAQGALGVAYTAAMGAPTGATIPAGTDIGGQTLYPGVYTVGGNLNISSADLTLSSLGTTNGVFIFQITGSNNLVVGPGRKVILSGGAQAANVFWVVGGYCSLNTMVSFVGNIMAGTSVTLNTGAVLLGEALAETGDVTLLGNTITVPGL